MEEIEYDEPDRVRALIKSLGEDEDVFFNEERLVLRVISAEGEHDIIKIEENGVNGFDVFYGDEENEEFIVLTDEEADSRCTEYLIDNKDLWKDAVENNRTEQGLEDWATEIIRMDGRGSVLADYDGDENKEEVDGVTYYIYRTNWDK